MTDGWIRNWKEFGRKRPLPNFKYYPGIYLEDWEKPQETLVRIAALGVRFEQTSRIQSKSANHSTTTSSAIQLNFSTFMRTHQGEKSKVLGTTCWLVVNCSDLEIHQINCYMYKL